MEVGLASSSAALLLVAAFTAACDHSLGLAPEDFSCGLGGACPDAGAATDAQGRPEAGSSSDGGAGRDGGGRDAGPGRDAEPGVDGGGPCGRSLPTDPAWVFPSIALPFQPDTPGLAYDLDEDGADELIYARLAGGAAQLAVVDLPRCAPGPVLSATISASPAVALAAHRAGGRAHLALAQGTGVRFLAWAAGRWSIGGQVDGSDLGVGFTDLSGSPDGRHLLALGTGGGNGAYLLLREGQRLRAGASAGRTAAFFLEGGGGPVFALLHGGGGSLLGQAGEQLLLGFPGRPDLFPTVLGPGALGQPEERVLAFPRENPGSKPAFDAEVFIHDGTGVVYQERAEDDMSALGPRSVLPVAGPWPATAQAFFAQIDGDLESYELCPGICLGEHLSILGGSPGALAGDLISAYLTPEPEPDVLVAARDGALFVGARPQRSLDRLPLQLPGGSDLTPTGTARFLAQEGGDGFIVGLVTTAGELSFLGWRRPAGAGDDRRLCLQHRCDAFRSGYVAGP